MDAAPEHDELRAFTADQLQEKLDDLEVQLKKIDDHDKITKAIRSSNVTAVEAAIETKKEISVKLSANKGNKEALRAIYFDMDEQDLLDAFEHHLNVQRQLMKEYLNFAVEVKEESDLQGPDELKADLEDNKVPDIVDVFAFFEDVKVDKLSLRKWWDWICSSGPYPESEEGEAQ